MNVLLWFAGYGSMQRWIAAEVVFRNILVNATGRAKPEAWRQ